MSGLAAFDRPQPAILAPVAAVGLGLVFDLARGVDPRAGLAALRNEPGDGAVAIGIGAPLALALGARIDGLHGFPAVSGAGVSFPSTQGALWVFVRGAERGAVLDRARAITRALGEGWDLREEVDTFRYREGRDLTGYVDGTENPTGEAAEEAALVGSGTSRANGMTGASFVAVQRFVHDLPRFEAFDGAARDAMVGRRADTNEEIEDAVATAHVKRTAQESFDPPAFMVRRSMPWGGLRDSGLYFVAYVASLDRFGRMLARMAGLEDGAVDGLLTVTRAVSGGYYFCPPMRGGELDLRALGLSTAGNGEAIIIPRVGSAL
jgi:putative iron-dependent peroxidase